MTVEAGAAACRAQRAPAGLDRRSPTGRNVASSEVETRRATARVFQERRLVRDSSRTGRRRRDGAYRTAATTERREDAGLVNSDKESATPVLARDVPLVLPQRG